MRASAEVNSLEKRLNQYFEDFDIVTWLSDSNSASSVEAFHAVHLPGVKKIDSRKQELKTKEVIGRRKPGERLLIFSETVSERPQDNWLFGFQQCYPVFRPDPVRDMLDDLEWSEEREQIVRQYQAVFRNRERLSFLKKAVSDEASVEQIERLLTHSVLGFRAHRPGSSLTVSLALGADEKTGKNVDFLRKNGLSSVLWNEVNEEVGYSHEAPSVLDLRFWMWDRYLASALHLAGAESASFTSTDWKVHNVIDLMKSNDLGRYIELAEAAQRELDLETRLEDWTISDLLSVKHVPAVDPIIAKKITDELANKDSELSDLDDVVERRKKQSAWFGEHQPQFETLRWLVRLREFLPNNKPHIPTVDAGLEKYVDSWFEIDRAYRKLVWWFGKLTFVDPALQDLFHEAEGRYVSFVSDLSGTWHAQVEKLHAWKDLSTGVPDQREFFAQHVAPALTGGPRCVAVVISDAMRFEVAVELAERSAKSRNHEIDISAQVAPLPSFTQLGMAVLLPHTSLQLRDGGDGLVLADHMSTSGLAARDAILANHGGAALRAEDLLDPAWTGSTETDLAFLYVYHDRIDQIGDKQATEGQTPNACEEAIQEVGILVKKLLKAGYSKVIVTADHGFLFQQRDLSDYDFVAAVPESDESTKTNRRFVIGKGQQSDTGLRVFTSQELGLDCDFDVLIPMSTQRLRRKGSGARFVHGGASLQEVVVPVVSFSQQKSKPLNLVDIALAPESSRKISTAQVTATLVQQQPVDSARAGFEARVVLRAGDQTLSETGKVRFDSADPEIRRRETSLSLLLAPPATQYSGQSVELVVEARVGTTNRWREVASFQMELVKAQERDF